MCCDGWIRQRFQKMLLFLTLALEMELFCWKWCANYIVSHNKVQKPVTRIKFNSIGLVEAFNFFSGEWVCMVSIKNNFFTQYLFLSFCEG